MGVVFWYRTVMLVMPLALNTTLAVPALDVSEALALPVMTFPDALHVGLPLAAVMEVGSMLPELVVPVMVSRSVNAPWSMSKMENETLLTSALNVIVRSMNSPLVWNAFAVILRDSSPVPPVRSVLSFTSTRRFVLPVMSMLTSTPETLYVPLVALEVQSTVSQSSVARTCLNFSCARSPNATSVSIRPKASSRSQSAPSSACPVRSSDTATSAPVR